LLNLTLDRLPPLAADRPQYCRVVLLDHIPSVCVVCDEQASLVGVIDELSIEGHKFALRAHRLERQARSSAFSPPAISRDFREKIAPPRSPSVRARCFRHTLSICMHSTSPYLTGPLRGGPRVAERSRRRTCDDDDTWDETKHGNTKERCEPRADPTAGERLHRAIEGARPRREP